MRVIQNLIYCRSIPGTTSSKQTQIVAKLKPGLKLSSCYVSEMLSGIPFWVMYHAAKGAANKSRGQRGAGQRLGRDFQIALAVIQREMIMVSRVLFLQVRAVYFRSLIDWRDRQIKLKWQMKPVWAQKNRSKFWKFEVIEKCEGKILERWTVIKTKG